MANAVRIVLSVVIGFVVWFAVATVGNLVIRATLPGYADAEPAMSFTLPMLLARLALGVVSSIVASFACAMALRSHPGAVKFFAIALVVFFLPIHYSLWARFPLWYHVVFLVSLAPLVLAGAKLVRLRVVGKQSAA
jgi:hypothetical protein